jgi:AraC family transcriptional regulator, regulatory protein of adaptative response / methylated-DNA-[protein]-cysteine methyltransferase
LPPICPSRIANPKNVQIHSTLAEAKATGFRPCKRCNPDDRSADDETAVLVAKACRLIDNSEEELSLDALATRVGRSSSHFHRLFKATTGLTPKEYADAHRAARIREGLMKNTSVTEAIYDAGFNSSGRFYEKSKELLGMTPTQYRTGGANEEINFALGQTTLGSILVASSKKGVVAILLGDDPDKFLRELQDRFPKAKLIGADKEYEKLVAHVVGFIEAPNQGLNLPLDIRGTAFQQRVWRVLQGIPAGKTVSYAEIAKKIGSPKLVRAVAGACAANNIAVTIPCHRVVRTDGSLSGYAWGIDRKRQLIDRERKQKTR